MMGGLLVPYVVRRPGAAFFGEVVAAFVSMALGNQWGILTMASGLVQGVGAETGVRGLAAGSASTAPALYGAAALAGAFSILLDTFVCSYYATYTWGSILVAGILCVVSSRDPGRRAFAAPRPGARADGRALRARDRQGEGEEDLSTAPARARRLAAGLSFTYSTRLKPALATSPSRSTRGRRCWCSGPAARARAR